MLFYDTINIVTPEPTTENRRFDSSVRSAKNRGGFTNQMQDGVTKDIRRWTIRLDVCNGNYDAMLAWVSKYAGIYCSIAIEGVDYNCYLLDTSFTATNDRTYYTLEITVRVLSELQGVLAEDGQQLVTEDGSRILA